MAFTNLCKMLREGFQKESESTGKERLLLTAAVAGKLKIILRGLEFCHLKKKENIKFFNILFH